MHTQEKGAIYIKRKRMHFKHTFVTSGSIRKTGALKNIRLPDRALNVRFKEN